MDDIDIASYIDHTELKPQAPYGRYTQLCREADLYRFHSVCVNSFYVPLVKQLIKGHTQVCSVIGFPHGDISTIAKIVEAQDAISNGATEIDTVINIGALKTGNYNRILDELKALKSVLRHNILKVILEVGLLTEEEVQKACEICIDAKVNFVKTSTGFNIKNTIDDTIRHTKLLLENVKGTSLRVKASSGINTLAGVQELIRLGVARIGTSHGISIMNDFEATKIKGVTK